MRPHTITHNSLKSFVDALGGSLDDDDINAAAGTEEGKHLLAWLEHQGALLDELKNDPGTHTILRDVALEKDEIPFRTVDPESLNDENIEKALGSLSLELYMPPSKLRQQAAFIKDENELAQRQIDVLTSRISKTKEASKALVHSIKSLQRVVHTLDAKIRNEEAKITELSFNTDCTVSTTISDAKATFQSLGCIPTNGDEPHAETVNSPDLSSSRAFLLGTKDRISRITSEFRNAFGLLSNLRKGQPEKIRDIENEASRLQAAFHSLDIEEEDVDVEAELRKICLLLEQEASKSSGIGAKSEIIATLLAETDDVSDDDVLVDHCNLNVQEVLHHAWIRDRISSSLTENAILDGAYASLNSVVKTLQTLRSSILPLVSCIREVEAVVEAFIEELADIALPEEDDNNLNLDVEDAEMEENLRRVLNENQSLRPPGALPLDLMTRDDILAEFQEIRNLTRNIESTERTRTENFIRQAAVRPLHTALLHIYANSPLHSSPPFSLPRDTQDLEACVRKIAGELQAIADTVEEEFKSSFAKDSNMKRLDAFVEKWTGK